MFEVYLPQILGDNSIDFSDHDYEHINALDLFLNRVINEKFSKETSFADYGNNFILEIVNNSCSLKLKLFRDCYLEFNNITLDSIKLFYADYHHNLIEYGKGRFDDRSDLGKSIYMICDDRDTYSMEEIEKYLEELRQDYLKKSDDELYTLAFTYPHIKRLLINLGIFKNNKIIR